MNRLKYVKLILSAGVSLLIFLSVGCHVAADNPPSSAGIQSAEPSAILPNQSSRTAEEALSYLRNEMDIYHRQTVIYDDADSGGERYFASGWMKPDNRSAFDISLTHSKDRPHSGSTCLKLTWTARNSWAGIYWQYPGGNWGKVPGLNLEGATRVTFWARGEKGNERVQFKFGGIRSPGLPYADSADLIESHWFTLSKEWKAFALTIEGQNLSNIIGAFCWVTNENQNPKGCTIYLDDITINQNRLHEPHLIRSYHIGDQPVPSASLSFLRNICYVYDNSLAICALLSSKHPDDQQRACLIADAFVQLVQYEGGFLRNAYCCGDLTGRDMNNRVEPRRPGQMTPMNNDSRLKSDWYIDEYALSIDAGNMAWAMIALLNVWERSGKAQDSAYLEAAKTLGDWIIDHCTADTSSSIGGFTGGLYITFKNPGSIVQSDLESNCIKRKKTWKSTEHNIDLAVAYKRIAEGVNDPALKSRYKKAADSAYSFVLWAREQGMSHGSFIVTGTEDNTDSPNLEVEPLDPQSWSLLAFPEKKDLFLPAVEWASKNLMLTKQGIQGCRYSGQSKEIWPEGTAQMACCYSMLCELGRAGELLDALDRMRQYTEDRTNVKGAIQAAYPNIVDTGFGWYYYNYPHVGATSWYILAHMKWNPYWNSSLNSDCR